MSIRENSEIGMAIALAVVLGLLTRFVQLPYGGSLNLSGLPLLALALYRGVKTGIIAGALYGAVDCMLYPFIVHPIQVVLDYPIAFAFMGVAGFAAGNLTVNISDRLKITVAIIAAGALRLLSHWLSGIVFFGHLAPEGQPVWIYSFVYNASYLIPEVIAYIILLQLGLGYFKIVK